jgi:hypothetical protein
VEGPLHHPVASLLIAAPPTPLDASMADGSVSSVPAAVSSVPAALSQGVVHRVGLGHCGGIGAVVGCGSVSMGAEA